MAEPIELVDVQDPSRVVAYACPTCGFIIGRTYDDPSSVERYRKMATDHCAPRHRRLRSLALQGIKSIVETQLGSFSMQMLRDDPGAKSVQLWKPVKTKVVIEEE